MYVRIGQLWEVNCYMIRGVMRPYFWDFNVICLMGEMLLDSCSADENCSSICVEWMGSDLQCISG